MLLLVLVTLVYEVGLRVADDRFPMTLVIGRTMWVAMLLLMFASAWDLSLHDYRQVLERWMRASLMATEVALLAVKWWWVVVAPLLIAWWIAGMLASRGADSEGKASIATGRLGFCVSLGTFVMMTMAIWALLSTVLDLAAKGVAYEPCIFVDGPAKQPQYAGFTSCPWVKLPLVVPEAASPANAKPDSLAAGAAAAAGPPPSSAQEFMARRYVATTAFFSLLAALLLSLILYLAVMLVPSILAELKLLRERARRDAHGGQARSRRTRASPVNTQAKAARDAATRRLGRWLTLGYRQLDRAVLTVTLLACLASAIVAMVLLGDHFGTSGLRSLLEWGEARASMVSQALLQPLILSAAAIATALTLLGGLLSKYLPSLRAPLDIALDVDNHFREFPRRSIPRARIFSRYKALLDHVAAQGYERVVIVAHSQGTVISAELLRFLASADTRRGGSQGQSPSWPQGTPGTGLSLLTLGCPLRQLYAARFPSLYHWVLRRQPGGNGPSAADIGVERWANAFASGDYVGRWLWSSPDFPGDVLGHPMLDTVHPKAFGRHDAYSPFDPVPPDAGGLATVRELEVCLGLGAHTHYFEPEQAGVAWLIDFLVGAPTLTPPARPEPVS